MKYIIFLAGGVGSRFWPLSRETEPKQFLNIGSGRPMLQDAVLRLGGGVSKTNLFIAASLSHAPRIKKIARALRIPAQNVLFEPAVKNTLAPIALLTEKIIGRDPHAVIAVIPCDHVVRDVRKFRSTLRRAYRIAESGNIVTLGFPPLRPETGYGYIRIKGKEKNGYFQAGGFLEKPTLRKAQKYVRRKRYFWNGGVFIFRADVMRSQLRRFAPKAYSLAVKMIAEKELTRHWGKLPSISIDYAIMEKTRKMVVVPARYGWLDLGSWQAVYDIMPKDRAGNILRGRCIDIGSTDSLIWSGHRLVATVGLRGITVVDTPDALLVCAKDRDQDVKKIVKQLGKKHKRRYI